MSDPVLTQSVLARFHKLVTSWCFKPSQPQRITSGLRETFITRCIVERTNKADNKARRTGRESGELSGEFME